MLKLSITKFYGKKQEYQYLLKVGIIYFECLVELFLTQLNLFDIYTDFSFLTIAFSEKELRTYFVLSLTSFVLTMIPKFVSFYIVI